MERPLIGRGDGRTQASRPQVMARRIPTSSFQPPNFKNNKYLDDAVKIANRIVKVMQPDTETCFKVSSEYVLSSVIGHLQSQGFRVQKVESTGELKQMVERGYIRWCVRQGVPKEMLQNKRRFWAFIEWVAEKPHLRESLVKTGWASWEHKWREEAFKKPLNPRG